MSQRFTLFSSMSASLCSSNTHPTLLLVFCKGTFKVCVWGGGDKQKGFRILPSSSMRPPDCDTSASQQSLCCVKFPTDSAVCLGPEESGESPEKHTAGRFIETEGKDSAGKRRRLFRRSETVENDCTNGEGRESVDLQGGCCSQQTQIKHYCSVLQN